LTDRWGQFDRGPHLFVALCELGVQQAGALSVLDQV
jgi:hypothetical protein